MRTKDPLYYPYRNFCTVKTFLKMSIQDQYLSCVRYYKVKEAMLEIMDGYDASSTEDSK